MCAEAVRLLLVHWNPVEAAERAQRLRRAGYDVSIVSDPRDGRALRDVRDDPPHAILVDLSRLPSHGRAVAGHLRRRAATRRVPIVFVGDPARVEEARRLLPDAGHAEWRTVRGAVRRAIARPPADPVVPGVFDEYAGRPLAGKLGIRGGTTVRLIAAPRGFRDTLGPLPSGARIGSSPADVAVLFCRSGAELGRRFDAAVDALAPSGRLWIAWPKRASGVVTDLDQAGVRAHGMGNGLVDFKVCSIDSTWSALCFVRRVPAS